MTLGLRPQSLRQTAAPVRTSGPPMFLYGLGAPKCGTTWLYDYLRGHPDCYVRGVKELNYFSSINSPLFDRMLDRLETMVEVGEADLLKAKPAERTKIASDILDARDYLRVLKTCLQDKNAYFRYMMLGIRQQRLVADISPEYGSLVTDMLEKMVHTANETRFLYIMRDPVDRFWSHVRMSAKKHLRPGEDFDVAARQFLFRAIEDDAESIRSHSNYAGVLARMEAVIPEERRLAMFYEDLMTVAGLKRLCAFLKIKPVKADFERQIFRGTASEMTAEDRAAVRRLLKPQYDAVASRFPVLPKAWQKTMSEGFA